MAIITITSAARCKDCKHLSCKGFRQKNGKIGIKHLCENPDSQHNGQRRAKRDLVCKNWEL